MRNSPKVLLCSFAVVASVFTQFGAATDRFAQTQGCANCRWSSATGRTPRGAASHPYHYRSDWLPDMGPSTPGPTNPSGPPS